MWKSFVDFHICHRMAPLEKLYFVTLTYFSEGQHFKGKNVLNDFYGFEYLLKNDTIAKFTPNDRDLLVKVNNMKFYYLEN